MLNHTSTAKFIIEPIQFLLHGFSSKTEVYSEACQISNMVLFANLNTLLVRDLCITSHWTLNLNQMYTKCI